MRDSKNDNVRFKKSKPSKNDFRKRQNDKKTVNDGLTRLNKHIARAGICSRREADKFIEAGVVKVNGKVITEMGYKVKSDDIVKFNDSTLKHQKLQYILLNKPKNYVTNIHDPFKKNSIMRLIEGKCKEDLSPIGKLDKTTTGLILFTNDGELTKKLSKRTQNTKSIYQINLDKNFLSSDLKKIKENIYPQDNKIKVIDISYVNGKDKKEIGIEVQSPTNNAVRAIFEDLGYTPTKIDRVYYGGLTKKNLARKESRFLTSEEITILKRQ